MTKIVSFVISVNVHHGALLFVHQFFCILHLTKLDKQVDQTNYIVIQNTEYRARSIEMWCALQIIASGKRIECD